MSAAMDSRMQRDGPDGGEDRDRAEVEREVTASQPPPRTPPPGRSSFQDASKQHAHRFERLLVVRGAPTKAFRDILGSSMSMLRPVAGPLQVQSLAPPQPQLHPASTYGSSFGAVAEASVGGHGEITLRPTLPAVTTTAPEPITSSRSATPSSVSGNAPTSAWSSGTELASSLSRSASVRSSRSARSTASVSSNASGTSSRRVYPVYNLEFHTLHHSVVVDAMTEERVARIHKRGVEITDFAMLDPVIYGQHYAIPNYTQRREQAAKLANASRSEGLSSFTQDFKPSSLLNKFKRFSLKSLGHPPPDTGVVSKRASLLRPAPSEPTTISGVPTVPLFREKTAQGELIDGTSTVQSATHAPGYVWLVRSFLRKDLIDASELCDFTIEWRKTRSRTRRRPTHSNTRGTQSASQSRRNSVYSEDEAPSTPGTTGTAIPSHMTARENSPSRPGRSFDYARMSDSLEEDGESRQSDRLRPEGALAARMLSPNALNRPATAPLNATRRSPSRSQSPAPSMTDVASISNLSHTDGGYDSGEESDPEDSEKPWACELVVKRPLTTPTEVPAVKRILLGTVTPSPHHPRLVAHMSIPLTLIPINIGTKGASDIHTISPEEMKDIVTVTGLWLIVREGLGLGGVKAKKGETS